MELDSQKIGERAGDTEEGGVLEKKTRAFVVCSDGMVLVHPVSQRHIPLPHLGQPRTDINSNIFIYYYLLN